MRGGIVSNQHILSLCILLGNNSYVLDIGVTSQLLFNLTNFNTVAPDFELGILASGILQSTIWQQANNIA
ncbi:hypothetical protein D1872_296100 [compost metagenome]